MSELPVPQHPFEVRISIGGDDWEYVRRAAQEVADYIAERTPETCNLASGGGGGSHSVHVQTRDISAEEFRRELHEWHIAQTRGNP